MTDKTQAKPRQAGAGRTWPKVLLAVSLAMNLAVIGLVAGAHLRDGHDDRRFAPADRSALRDSGVGPFFAALPREDRGRVIEDMRARGAELRPDRARLAAEFEAMVRAMRAEPFDAAALAAVLADQHARAAARSDIGRAALVARIAAMSPEARADFAERLERGLARDAARRSGEKSDEGRRD